MSIKEMTMSQETQQEQDLRRSPTLKPQNQEEPITGPSPDDDIGVTSENTGKPGAPTK